MSWNDSKPNAAQKEASKFVIVPSIVYTDGELKEIPKDPDPLNREYGDALTALAEAIVVDEQSLPNTYYVRYGETMKNEADPNGLSQHAPGAKMDAGKAPVMQGVIQYFPRALKAISMVSLVGAKKYAWKGWEAVPDGINRYSDALGRHLLAETIEGPIDADTQQLHASQVAWNALARLELILRDLEEKK